MKANELVNVRLFVGLGGGEVFCVGEDGQTKWKLGLTAGSHYADTLRVYLERGDELHVGENVTAMKQGVGRLSVQTYGADAAKTAANPDYRPTSADIERRRMEQMVREITQRSNSLDRRMAAFERVQAETAARLAAEQEAAQVIDDAPAAEAEQAPE